MSNEDIIKELKEQIEKLSKNTTYEFIKEEHKLSDGSTIFLLKNKDHIVILPTTKDKPITYKNPDVKVDIGEPREYNEKELGEWIINRLRYYYFSNKELFGKQVYRSLKGMVKRGNIQPALRYIELNWNKNIYNDYNDMTKAKHILPIIASITFLNSAKIGIIDIEIPGGDKS